jgi:hypothetical protein
MEFKDGSVVLKTGICCGLLARVSTIREIPYMMVPARGSQASRVAFHLDVLEYEESQTYKFPSTTRDFFLPEAICCGCASSCTNTRLDQASSAQMCKKVELESR